MPQIATTMYRVRWPARHAGLLIMLTVACAMVGCVERTITIETSPPGALVYLNDEEVGRSPMTVPFTWHGEYSVRLERDGYQTLSTSRSTNPPIHEYPGPDLVTELMPWKVPVHVHWVFVLDPVEPTDEAELIQRAESMRQQYGEAGAHRGGAGGAEGD